MSSLSCLARHSIVAWGLTGALAIAAALAVGCAKKAGGLCFNVLGECGDPSTELECTHFQWQAYECGGARGCVMGPWGWPVCDQRIAHEGEVCRTPGGMEIQGPRNDLACSPDGRSLLTCGSERFGFTTACNGPQGCRMATPEGTLVTIDCDVETAVEGAPCGWPATWHACSPDRATMLQCDTVTNRWVTSGVCRGTSPASQCSAGQCFQEFAREGDVCRAQSQDMCSEDGRSVLACKDGKRTAPVACTGPRACERLSTPERHAAAHCDRPMK